MQLDDVHGGHGEAGAVDQAADVAVQLDVVQVAFLSDDLVLRLLSLVLLREQLLLTEFGVIVDSDLRVAGQESAIGGCHQGVNLNQVAIILPEHVVQLVEQVSDFLVELRHAKLCSGTIKLCRLNFF